MGKIYCYFPFHLHNATEAQQYAVYGFDNYVALTNVTTPVTIIGCLPARLTTLVLYKVPFMFLAQPLVEIS